MKGIRKIFKALMDREGYAEDMYYLEARRSCDLDDGLNVIFIENNFRLNEYKWPGIRISEVVLDFFSSNEISGTNIVLGDESLNGCMFTETDRYAISKMMHSEKQVNYLFFGNRLFDSNGNSTKLNKIYPGYIHGDGDLGFRVCSGINEGDLSDVKYYFVSASCLGKVYQSLNGSVVYINDALYGFRRKTANCDSRWINHKEVGSFNNEKVRHYVIRV